MYARVPRISTSMPWQEIAGYHPRQVRESRVGAFECVEGLLVDDGPKPPLAARKKSLPFRFYIPTEANFDALACRVWTMIEAKRDLVNVLLAA
jgi:hypothetical protein